MNRKTLAKEWLVCITAGIAGYLIVPAVITYISDGELAKLSNYYCILIDRHDKDFVPAWLFVTVPYFFAQSVRITIWSIKQLRAK